MVNNKKEIWLSIPGYYGLYSISNLGRVRKDKDGYHIKSGEFLKDHINKYKRVSLRKNKKQKNIFIHRLIALTFIGKRPRNYQVNHKDGNKLNNHISNLEYVTSLNNHKHAVKMGLKACGEKQHLSIFTNQDILIIRNRYFHEDISIVHLSKIYDCCPSTIGRIVRRETWKSI